MLMGKKPCLVNVVHLEESPVDGDLRKQIGVLWSLLEVIDVIVKE